MGKLKQLAIQLNQEGGKKDGETYEEALLNLDKKNKEKK
tara:strand:- start:1696 stop:1812 length:117 start_codon:yes stop_codon:yes gene_type:complete